MSGGAERQADGEVEEPRVRATQISCARCGEDWRVAWRVDNLTTSDMRLLDVRFPHGRFRSGLRDLADVRVSPSASTDLEAVVACHGRDGEVVENTFLISTVEWRKIRWRILVRMTVRFGADGSPAATTELVTVQRVGFSAPEGQEKASGV